MVAVLGEKVVRGAEKLVGSSSKSCVNLLFGRQSESVEDLTSECASGRFGPRFCPVHTSEASLVMSTICVFLSVDDDA
jgi:hypothetical protein